jgi:hypothetical protein
MAIVTLDHLNRVYSNGFRVVHNLSIGLAA